MKKYDSYKESGIDWIGEIPINWNIKKLKFISKICNGQDQKAVLDDNGIYPVYGSGGIFGKANSYLFDKPSVLLGRKGTIDKPQYVEEPFWTVDTSYYTKIHDGFSVRLFYYLCTTINFELYKYGSAIPSMTQGHLNEIKFAIPETFDEQIILANYLDHKTSQIEHLIAKKEQFIQLLEEERVAVINQAVTKGLDPNVPMKDSGIEWLGEIPEHWELWKISHAFKRIGSGTTPESGNPTYHENGTINWLNTGDLNDGEVASCNKRITEQAMIDYTSLKLFPAGSLIMAMYGATIGKTGIIKFDTTTNQACCVFCEGEIIDLKFLQYWFLAKKENIINLAIGGGQPNISQNILKDIRVNCTSITEQLSIVKYLDLKTKEIDLVKSKAYQEIELLKEYKTALISEVVSGKVDVRELL